MRKSRKFISMPIVSLEEGIQIGLAKNIVIDPYKMEIAAIIVDQRGWFREQKIIPYTKVRSIGDDAITIDQSISMQRPISLPHILKLIKENVKPLGVKVITENGTVLGVVDEYYIDEKTGEIKCFEISGKFLESLFKGKALMPVEHIRTLGSDIIIVNEGTEEHLKKVDSGLNETIHNLKESTSTLWETTKKHTGNIRQTLKTKYEKIDAPEEFSSAEATENFENEETNTK
ncbi:PRC-barrel domain-containing protein [Phosphitispora sp. TUW77]|uniref:PRC-barrel domain-containing protein n=1 Tax=Phosphitispora sp. TUW77 TaxID=3152361 RepID=UPI003AB45CC6